ncbi:hypothetical protein M408DRAFT_9842 [Serendipita vermifera MAFF 305830]|uniref:Uncharacterized protein n=1 Tax=Serendipita vermifera MAFF 305830 TaxID=933852 RepID=A0A0C2WJZ2_SERVB|nr:hypothetical protein M408DRAFT_9842 [Serendipita vermifera MAFF 305830]
MTPDLLSGDELELLDRSDSLKPAGKTKRSRSHVDPNRTVSSVSSTHSTSYDTQLGGNTKGHTFQRPRASLIASTFRKLRGRRTTPAGEDPSIPALPDLSFLISAAEGQLLTQECDEDQVSVLIDAGVVIAPPVRIPVLDISPHASAAPLAEPMQTEAERYKEMILKQERERSARKFKSKVDSLASICLAPAAKGSGTQITSATETAFSSSSGTEAGSEEFHTEAGISSDRNWFSRDPLPTLRRSISLTLPRRSIDDIDYGEVDGILKVLFPIQDDACSPVWNRASFGSPLPEGSSPNLMATMRTQTVPTLALNSRRPSAKLYSRPLQPLAGPGSQHGQQCSAPLDRKKSRKATRPFNGPVEKQCATGAYDEREQKVPDVPDEVDDILQTYAQMSDWINLEGEE